MLPRSRALFAFQQARLHKQLLAGRLHILKGGGGNGTPGDADCILARDNVLPSQPNGFAHQPSHSIAFNGVANAFAGGEAKAIVGEIVRKDDEDDQPMLVTASLTSHLLKTFFGS